MVATPPSCSPTAWPPTRNAAVAVLPGRTPTAGHAASGTVARSGGPPWQGGGTDMAIVALLVLSLCGTALMASSPNNSVAELVGAVLTLAPIMAIPVGYGMGLLT